VGGADDFNDRAERAQRRRILSAASACAFGRVGNRKEKGSAEEIHCPGVPGDPAGRIGFVVLVFFFFFFAGELDDVNQGRRPVCCCHFAAQRRRFGQGPGGRKGY
jgi:hypothetical protein